MSEICIFGSELIKCFETKLCWNFWWKHLLFLIEFLDSTDFIVVLSVSGYLGMLSRGFGTLPTIRFGTFDQRSTGSNV